MFLPRRYRFIIFVPLSLLLWFSMELAVDANAGELARLAVVGVTNASAESELSDLLIAQGIAQLSAQELYDTGMFIPVEDNPEIAGRVAELIALAIQGGGDGIPPDRLLATGRELGCDTVATVRITRFGKSRSKAGFGPFSSARVEVEIEVEVSLKDEGRAPIAARGTGSGTTKSQAFLFQIRKDKVNFDQTSVGRATQDAVREAVRKVTSLRTEIP